MVLPSDSAAERLVSPDLCWSCLHYASFPVELPSMSRGGLRVGFAPFAAGGFVGRSIGYFACVKPSSNHRPSYGWVLSGEMGESWEEKLWEQLSGWTALLPS